MTQPSILICTVGTGNVEQLRDTLLEPLKKSISKGEWSRVILLPSQVTRENAAKLRAALQHVPIEIHELPQPGAEDDADACFAHFDGVVAGLRAQGVRPESLLVDFTRGTKAMSAALVLTAVRHELPQLRYITSATRDERGMVLPGTEIVAEVRTTIATAQRRLDDAHNFLRHGNFAAVLETLPDPSLQSTVQWPQHLLDLAALVRTLAAFCEAWDRLDYKTALSIQLPAPQSTPSHWRRFVPPPAIHDWVRALAEPLPEANRDRAAHLRLLVADLLANGERRLRHHQYEDAIIRGYRVLELIGQIRLFERGFDSAELNSDHPDIKAFQEKLIKKKSQPLTEKDGKYQASREQVARLLKHLGDPLAEELLRLGNRSEGEVKLSRRNYSIWIHGFEAIAGSDPGPIRVLFSELEKLLVEDGGPTAKQSVQNARWLDVS